MTLAQHHPSSPDAGFTLVEVLVALVILAVGAVSVLSAAELHASRVGDLRDRTVARWVAENALASDRLGMPRSTQATMLGADWRIDTIEAETSDPTLIRLDVSVGPAGGDATLYTLTGFVDTGTGASQ